MERLMEIAWNFKDVSWKRLGSALGNCLAQAREKLGFLAWVAA
jgi:hypothetical protein